MFFTKDRLRERHARQESHGKTIEHGSEHDSPAARGVILEGVIIPARKPREESGRPGPVWTLIGLALVYRALRDPRLYVAAIVGATGLAAMTQIALKEAIPNLMRPFIWYWAGGRPRQKGAAPAR